jgi:hypothetical protein
MTTRLFLWGIALPSVKPPASSLWTSTNTTSFPHARLHTTKGNSYSSATASYTASMINGKDYKVQTLQSRPMAAQTIPSGPLQIYAQVRESVSTADLRSQVTVKATDISGQVTKAVLYAGDLSSVLTSEWLPSSVSRSFPRLAISPVTLPSYVASEGDRIVIELGARLLGPTGSYTASISNSDSLAAIAANETSSVLGSPWVELPGDIAFLPWVISTIPISWETRSQVINTYPVNWSQDAKVIATLPVYWYDLTTIYNSFPIKYQEFTRVVSTLTVDWDVAGRVVATVPVVYDVDKTVIKTTPVVYDIQDQITRSFDIKWDDRTQVISTHEMQWNVGEPPPIISVLPINWETHNRVISTLDIEYSSYAQVVSTLPVEWDSIARAVSIHGVYWYDFATVNTILPLFWTDLVPVVSEITAMWTNQQTVIATTPIAWEVAEAKATVISTLPVYWYTRQTVTSLLDVEWNQDEPVSVQIISVLPISWLISIVLPPPPPDDTDVIHVVLPSDTIRLQIYPTPTSAGICR